jgi:hypothetical protein
MPLHFGADRAGLIADARGFGSQFGIVHHLLDVAQSVGPVQKIFAGDRRELAIRAPLKLPRTSGLVGVRQSLSASLATLTVLWLARLTLAVLRLLSTLTWLTGLLTGPGLSALNLLRLTIGGLSLSRLPSTLRLIGLSLVGLSLSGLLSIRWSLIGLSLIRLSFAWRLSAALLTRRIAFVVRLPFSLSPTLPLLIRTPAWQLRAVLG